MKLITALNSTPMSLEIPTRAILVKVISPVSSILQLMGNLRTITYNRSSRLEITVRNLKSKLLISYLVPGGASPSHAGVRIEEKAPSVVQFRDYANMDDIIRKSQTSKPFASKKRTSQDARIDIQKSNFNRLRESNDKKSLVVQGSTLRRKNSQTESEIYNDFKSDILMQTHGSKFNPSGR